MSVEKIVFRSFLCTLAAIAMLLVFMTGVLVAVYPETMMNIAYDMGMEKSSVWFAERAYKRHDKIDTIAFAITVAIEEDMYDKVISCGDKMIVDDEFGGYCEKKDLENYATYGDQEIDGMPIIKIIGEYDQYIYAQISVAQYKMGDTDGAVERAVALTEGFPRNNAVACLLLEAEKRADETLIQTLREQMESFDQSDWSEDDKAYYGEICAVVEPNA